MPFKALGHPCLFNKENEQIKKEQKLQKKKEETQDLGVKNSLWNPHIHTRMYI